MSSGIASEDARLPSRWRGILPALRWLRTYDRGWFRADLAAGVTLAAYLLPAALGDASLAGLPPQAGLQRMFKREPLAPEVSMAEVATLPPNEVPDVWEQRV